MDNSWKPETFSVEEIVTKIRNKSITVPLYQRGQVWEEAKEKALIESIKLGYPFGSILLYKKHGDEYHLIDGLQRCTTFYRYLEDPAHYFDNELDVDDAIVDKIYEMMGTAGDIEATKGKIRSTIQAWVLDNSHSLKNAYMSFIEKRFSMQKKILLTNLYSVPQNHQ